MLLPRALGGPFEFSAPIFLVGERERSSCGRKAGRFRRFNYCSSVHRYLVLLGLALIAVGVLYVFVDVTRIRFLQRLRVVLRMPTLERFENNGVVDGLRRLLSRLAQYETFIFVAMVLLFGVISVVEGTDRTYDLLNYHYVNGFLALTRNNWDIAASGIQGFFNPTIDVFTYVGYRYLAPWLVLFLFGVIQGLAFPLIYKVARALEFERLTSYFAAGCGLFSAISMSEMGLALGDSILVPLIMLALVLVLKSSAKHKTPFIVSGALVGFAVGLKLTAVPMLIGLFAFVWFLSTHGSRIRLTLWTVVGGVIGGLVSYGWWAWRLFSDYRNPVFPMYNQYFNSSYGFKGLNNGVDDRVKSIGQFLFFSYDIMIHPLRTGAGVLRDYSFPIIETILIVMVIWWMVRSLRARRLQKVFNYQETRALVAFYLASYVVWVFTTGIFRYMVALDMLGFVMIAVLLRDLVATTDFHRVLPYALAAIFAAISLTQLSPIWYFRIPVVRTEFSVSLPPALTSKTASVVFADGNPDTWIVPYLPRADFVSRVFNWKITPTMAAQIQSRITTTGNPIVVWTDGSSVPVIDARLQKVNLKVVTSSCTTFQGTAGGLVQTFVACRATALSAG